ncbi:MAG: glycosyltransferase family 1 protein [Planctomycetota bacterium]
MKILFDATVFQQPFTGIAKSTLALYQACLARMPKLEFTALHQRPLTGALPSSFHAMRYGSALPSVIWRKTVLPVMALSQRAGIIHFPWNGNVPALFSGAKVITTIHDVLPLIIPNYFKHEQAKRHYHRRIQRDISRSRVVFTVSEFSKTEILKNFDIKTSPIVIRHAPTLSCARTSATSDDGDYFLYVGGYDLRKGLEALLRVFLTLRHDRKLRSRLILTGSRHYFSDSFKRLVEQGTRAGVVEEKGYVSDELLGDLLSRAKGLVYPSKYEGFGLPPLEAMAAGCPVLTTRGTALPEICGDAALYVDPDNDSEFSVSLMRLESDSDLRQKLASAGRKQATRFSWDASAQIFLDEVMNCE